MVARTESDNPLLITVAVEGKSLGVTDHFSEKLSILSEQEAFEVRKRSSSDEGDLRVAKEISEGILQKALSGAECPIPSNEDSGSFL